MEKALKEKLEAVVDIVNNIMVDPDIDLEYHIPEVASTPDDDATTTPYILAKYSEDEYLERKINLREEYLKGTAEDIANLVTFYIEQMKEEVDSLHYGAQ